MKTRNRHFILTTVSAVLLVPAAFAVDTDGTWTNASGGSWNTDTNWSGGPPGIIADGSGFTANFNAMDIPAGANVVTLDADRMIGNIIFGDSNTATAGTWTLNATPLNFFSGAKLTLAGTTPTITTNVSTTINAPVEGSSGFTKAGTASLVLVSAGSATTISGAVVVSAGSLQLNNTALKNATSVALNGGTLVLATSGANAIGGTISFGGGTLQYNSNPGTDFSSQFSAAASQAYKINTISSTRVLTFSSNLASSGGTLEKIQSGKLILAAANDFNGATKVSGGNLALSHAQALQNSPLDTANIVTADATKGLILSGVTTPTFGGLTGSKALLSLFDTDAEGSINNGGYAGVTNLTLNPGTGANYSYSGVIEDGRPAIDGGMTLTKTGEGKQTLSGINTYTGGTILSGGILNYGNASALSSGSISFNGNSTLQAGVATTLANPVSVANSITGTVDTNNFATTLSGALTGNGSLTKTGAGILTLTGGEANTLAGAININTGRLASTDGTSFKNMTGAITVASGASFQFSQSFTENNLTNALNLSGAGNSATVGALHIYGNATASGVITLDADTTITHSFNNAYLTGSITGTNRNLTLKTTQAGQFPLTISGPIQLGSGGITVAAVPVAPGETNIVTLSGNNAYSGETRVQTGTLKLTGSARIPDASAVRIDTGAVLDLDFSGSDTVAALYLPGDPNPKPDGTYGSLASTADNKSADFLGDGILQVGVANNNYASWASSQVPPVTGGENGDDDNDGVKNLVEYALVNGGERGVLSGTTITFTKRGTPYGGDLTYIIETSETLSDPWSPAVTHGPAELGSPISYNLNPLPGTPKKFARLKVVKVP